MKKYLSFLLAMFVLLQACKKDDDENITPGVQDEFILSIQHVVDGADLISDSIMYVNDAGNHYSVNRLWYYLSNVSLVRPDSTLLQIHGYLFIDGFNPYKCSFNVSSIPQGDYIGLVCNIGLDSAKNLTNALPAITDNLNMEWPGPMGGGYHFMKFEGHYQQNDSLFGFAMHLGRNEFLVRCAVWGQVQIHSGRSELKLRMNLNEWFRNPSVYDFNMDGNYSMGNMMAMDKLMRNGENVFTMY